jgi:hypothetical protein
MVDEVRVFAFVFHAAPDKFTDVKPALKHRVNMALADLNAGLGEDRFPQ